jgi:sirohydrochlorin cobaltochelatase
LILLGHGSKAPEALEEMGELAAKLQAKTPGIPVLPAFLSLAQPDLAAAVADAVRSGAGEIRVLPLFFFSGKHVQEDVPRLVAEAQAAHPAVRVTLLQAAGRHPGVLDFLVSAGDLAPT